MVTINFPVNLDHLHISDIECLDEQINDVLSLICANKMTVCIFHKDNADGDPDEYAPEQLTNVFFQIGKYSQYHNRLSVAINAIGETHQYFMLTFHNNQ